jgi:hypothetical protein
MDRIGSPGSLFCAVLLSVVPAWASSIQTYAYTAAGQSSCATFATTSQVRTTIGSGSVEVSTPSAGCNVTESLMDLSGAVGPLNASSAATGGGGTTFGIFSYSGTSRSHGDYTTLGVEAEGTLSGATDAFSTRGSEAFAKMDDGYLAPSSIGPNGFVQFNYMLHGTQTVSGRGDTTLELLFAKNAGPGFLAFRANNVTGQGTTVIVNGAFATTLPGLVISTGSITVDTALSFLVPASSNEHFDLSMVLYGSAIPNASTGQPSPSSVADDFFGTLTITSINVLDSNGNLITGAQVMRDSTTIGAVASPEPGSMLLAGAALAAVALLRKNLRPSTAHRCL